MGGGESPCAGDVDVPVVGAQIEEKVGCCGVEGDGSDVVVGYCYERRGPGHAGSWLLCGRLIRKAQGWALEMVS